MYKKILLSLALVALCVLGCSKFGIKYSWDLSQNKINTISKTTQDLLDSLDTPLLIEIYSPKMDMLNFCNAALERYALASKQISIVIKQTLIDPDLADTLKVNSENILLLTYKNRQEAADIRPADLNEQFIGNIIQRVIIEPNQWVVFLSGHQESDPFDKSLMGLSDYTKIIMDRGLRIAQLNLAQQQQIPSNTQMLIVANPQFELLPAEQTLLTEYLQRGGKMIWFTEPDSPATEFLHKEFGLQISPGVAIDPNSLNLGSPHPALKVVTLQQEHSITKDIKTATILPWSGNLFISKEINEWQSQSFLQSNAQTWTYNGPATDDLKIFAQYKAKVGPLDIGFTFSRNIAEKKGEQRAIVIADSSFILNKYLGLYANAQLASNILNWVPEQQQNLTFISNSARDVSYNPNNFNLFLLRYGFTLLLPLLLIGLGFYMQPRKTLAETSK